MKIRQRTRDLWKFEVVQLDMQINELMMSLPYDSQFILYRKTDKKPSFQFWECKTN